MNAKRIFAALTLCLAALPAFSQSSQGADPKTVVPAWVTEKQIAQNQEQNKPPEQPKAQNLNLFFIGYDLPTLSGSLASHLTSWQSPINFSLGMDTTMGAGSSMLTGIELELFLTFTTKGSRMLMNDMAMIGYSFDLQPVRLNVGARLGLTLLDVTDDTSSANTYTGLGGVIGPEASLYLSLAKDFWVWARGRYTFASYFSLDNNAASPIATGSTGLNCLSFEAGVAFKM